MRGDLRWTVRLRNAVAVVEEPGPYHWWGRLTSPTDQKEYGRLKAGLSGFRVRSSNKGACVWRQAGTKSEVDNQSTNGCRDSGKTADATGSFMCFWHQNTTSSGFCCSCHSTGEVKVIYGCARPGLSNSPHHLGRPLRGGMTGVSHPMVSRGQGLRNAETSPLP